MAEYEPRKDEGNEKALWRKKPRDSAPEKVKEQGDTREANVVEAASVEGHAALLSDARLSHPASAGQLADIVSGLQRSYGNAYVQRLLRSRSLQAKLTVNPPDDQYEKEADQVADVVAKAPDYRIQRQAEGEEEEEEEEKEEVSMKAVGSHVPEVSEELETSINAAKGGGEPLPDSIRASIEPHFGRDFSDVRVHTDAEADNMSQQLGARAFTTGHDVFFREGDYQPESESGRKLIGHEMTHVVQQGGAPISMKAVETEEKETAKNKEQVIPQLRKAKDKALSDMTKANVRELLLHAAHCQQIGAAEAAKDALDQASSQALGMLKKNTQAFNVVTSSRKMARELLDQIAKVQLLGAEGAGKAAEKALEKLLQWAQAQLAGAIKALQTAPSEGTAREGLEKAALVQMLGGDATVAIAAVKTWAETEKT